MEPDKTISKKLYALDLAAGIEVVRAVRDPDNISRWSYLAEETGEWYSVSSDALVELAQRIGTERDREIRQGIYDAWAKADDTAICKGRRP